MAKSGTRDGRRTRRGTSAQHSDAVLSETHSARTARGPEKYAALTVYDPATKTVRDAKGNDVTQRAPTLAELSAMPGPLAVLDRLYECEDADEKTIAGLAQLAGCTVATLEAKRRDWQVPPVTCPPRVRENRRRCWRCPRWTETNATPFD